MILAFLQIAFDLLQVGDHLPKQLYLKAAGYAFISKHLLCCFGNAVVVRQVVHDAIAVFLPGLQRLDRIGESRDSVSFRQFDSGASASVSAMATTSTRLPAHEHFQQRSTTASSPDDQDRITLGSLCSHNQFLLSLPVGER